MHKLLLAAAALGGLTVLTGASALAAPSAAGLYVAPAEPLTTNVDYYYHHHRYHHRRWYHHHWRYY